jgi:hypothetical protein
MMNQNDAYFCSFVCAIHRECIIFVSLELCPLRNESSDNEVGETSPEVSGSRSNQIFDNLCFNKTPRYTLQNIGIFKQYQYFYTWYKLWYFVEVGDPITR